jgi:hypothetical protein
LNYYVVLGIAEDADEETIGAPFERWRGATTRMLALAPRLLISSALAKHLRRSPIPNAVAGTSGNCETLVPDRSWFDR